MSKICSSLGRAEGMPFAEYMDWAGDRHG
jgi:hypothetical protein